MSFDAKNHQVNIKLVYILSVLWSQHFLTFQGWSSCHCRVHFWDPGRLSQSDRKSAIVRNTRIRNDLTSVTSGMKEWHFHWKKKKMNKTGDFCCSPGIAFLFFQVVESGNCPSSRVFFSFFFFFFTVQFQCLRFFCLLSSWCRIMDVGQVLGFSELFEGIQIAIDAEGPPCVNSPTSQPR
jgi:hypothetical protein